MRKLIEKQLHSWMKSKNNQMLVSGILTHFKRCLSSILRNYFSFQIYLPFTNSLIFWTCKNKLITRMQEKKLLQLHLPSNKCKKNKCFNEDVCYLLTSGIVSVLHCILLMNYIIVVLVGWTDAEMSVFISVKVTWFCHCLAHWQWTWIFSQED